MLVERALLDLHAQRRGVLVEADQARLMAGFSDPLRGPMAFLMLKVAEGASRFAGARLLAEQERSRS